MQKQWHVDHTQATTATPEAIWHRWTDVEGWPEEDANLESARLDGAFVVGSKIVMKPKGSPKSTVILTAVNPNKSFTTEGKIPLGKIIIAHSVKSLGDGKTSFTHSMTLTGSLRNVFVILFAQKLADNLPQKMKNIARLAETI